MKTRKQQPGPVLFTQLGPGQDSIVSLENIGFIFYQYLRLLYTFSYIFLWGFLTILLCKEPLNELDMASF